MELNRNYYLFYCARLYWPVLAPTITSIEIGRNCSEVGVRSRIKDRHAEYGI